MRTLPRPGHALSFRWNGTPGPGSSVKVLCQCGWADTAKSKARGRLYYREHLADLRRTEVLNDPSPTPIWRPCAGCGSWVPSPDALLVFDGNGLASWWDPECLGVKP